MEQQSALLAAWMEGASISTLHFLIAQPEHVLEDQLRKALLKLRDAEAPPPAPVVAIAPPVNCQVQKRGKAKPGQAMRKTMAGECEAKRATQSISKTSPASLVKASAGLGPEELRGYPATMRMKNQSTARQVWQQIKAGPKTLDNIADALGVSYDTVWLACKNMLKAGLVERTDEQPYRWRLVDRPADAATGT